MLTSQAFLECMGVIHKTFQFPTPSIILYINGFGAFRADIVSPNPYIGISKCIYRDLGSFRTLIVNTGLRAASCQQI